ncbi:MAG TPA: sugar phosphate isomerase/epimerase [Armatimonadota bacterium]|jgi:inosose dehydratase
MNAAYHLINFGVWPNRSEDDKLRAVQAVGYPGVESVRIDYTAEPARVADRLAGFGLRLAAQNFPGRLLGQDDQELTALARQQVAFGAALGCDVTVAMVPRSDGKDIHTYGTTTDHYQEAARRLNLVGRILADGGIKLTIHNHIDHLTETGEEMDLLMQETQEPLVGICFDTAHAVCGGNDPLAYATRYHSRIRHLHLKDAKNLLYGRPYFFKNAFLPLGEGIIDFDAIMAALPGYTGWITVELDAAFSNGDPEKEAATSLAYLRQRHWA